MKKSYYALAYYSITPVENPHEEIALHKKFLQNLDVACRIYISEQGINGQLSGYYLDAEYYMDWLKQRPCFLGIKFKIHHIKENIFPRITVKYRKELATLGCNVDLSLQAKHISPQEWHAKLQQNQCLVLDVRNNYEWKIGHFENALLPNIKTFREFPLYAERLVQEYDPETTPIMMYCTGGIRCELYSPLVLEKGFKEVYQLDGGVIAYGQHVGTGKWLGKLFVFDDRLAIPIDEQNPNVASIASCSYCSISSDSYYNCANTDCNLLFLCCKDCISQHYGCCSPECLRSPRLRKFNASRGNKPFRRIHLCETGSDTEEVLSCSTSSLVQQTYRAEVSLK
ncbi:rhodanese-related sulfurtransferase [Candidatus Chlamydia sanziniae]|uniref:tRNA uridine(34) hydroxylase n=1 Tax=Candidatus Chlamydia sanziniae TaxID=1806891 RepID=A0A1A9HU77_9CHLA|nr:rhodanese-related sulfurtransferase [Candidatus Chlamydia sanziniae]ANH78538.1 Rhodanese domain protein [Candidatus Chlamydia sanziniae]